LIITIFIAEAKGIINFIAGPEYDVSVDLLKILIWPTTIIFFSSFFNYGIIAIEKQKEVIKYFLISAVISLFGYFVFIPKYSYFGAAYTTLVVELLMAIFSYFLLRRYTKWNINFKNFSKILIISYITYTVLSIININFVIELLIGGSLYFILIFVFKIFSQSSIKEIFSFRKNN